MKKTYDRKFFRQKLLSEKKTVTAVSRLLIILLLGFPLLTRAGTSGSSRERSILYRELPHGKIRLLRQGNREIRN